MRVVALSLSLPSAHGGRRDERQKTTERRRGGRGNPSTALDSSLLASSLLLVLAAATPRSPLSFVFPSARRGVGDGGSRPHRTYPRQRCSSAGYARPRSSSGGRLPSCGPLPIIHPRRLSAPVEGSGPIAVTECLSRRLGKGAFEACPFIAPRQQSVKRLRRVIYVPRDLRVPRNQLARRGGHPRKMAERVARSRATKGEACPVGQPLALFRCVSANWSRRSPGERETRLSPSPAPNQLLLSGAGAGEGRFPARQRRRRFRAVNL